MPCPTCDHTMACLLNPRTPAALGDESLFWCERCGTLLWRRNGVESVSRPMLVDRCRDFK